MKQYKKINRVPASVWKNPWHFLAFGCGVGAIPFAPGTFGTLAAMPFYLILARLPLVSYLIIVLLAFGLASWLCDVCSKTIGVHDHGGMVIDEVVGYLITMIAVPLNWKWMLLGFVLFRIFDIVKPWPINLADKYIHGGFGVMFDDALAAIYSLVVLQIVVRLFV